MVIEERKERCVRLLSFALSRASIVKRTRGNFTTHDVLTLVAHYGDNVIADIYLFGETK